MSWGSCTSQPTKTSIGATHTTPSSSLRVHGLWPQICPLWLLHSLLPHQLSVGRQTQSPSQFPFKMGKGKNYQTWFHPTPHDHSRQVVPVNVSPLFEINSTIQIYIIILLKKYVYFTICIVQNSYYIYIYLCILSQNILVILVVYFMLT